VSECRDILGRDFQLLAVVVMRKVVFGSSGLGRLLLLVFLWGQTMLPAQYPDGIYAEFNTSMGSFTCRLEYVLAPKTCANFIGLATGQRSWLDLPSGVVKTNPFYNGTTFHRVIAGFMNQGGSPNGLGTDGPGYAFIDEFTNSLRHDSFGVLSSANSGPDSNGAQYFITVAPTPWLNDVHSIFGKLYGGSNVVHAINNVATNANSKPLTNVTVNNIAIRRIGPAAQAFDIHAQGLPLVTNLNVKIARVGTNVSLTFSNRLYADNRLYSSANLINWLGTELGIETGALFSDSVSRNLSAPAQFYRMAQVQYAASTLAPKTLLNRTLTLNFSGGWGTITITFNSTGGGNYTDSLGPPGTVTSYDWAQQPYRGYSSPINFSGLASMYLRLDFTSGSTGTISGQWYGSPMFGSFTLTGP
jgi:cyclophilin family peptidyl-prolyl cis-trans isomerase